jgi:hypothetical protein
MKNIKKLLILLTVNRLSTGMEKETGEIFKLTSIEEKTKRKIGSIRKQNLKKEINKVQQDTQTDFNLLKEFQKLKGENKTLKEENKHLSLELEEALTQCVESIWPSAQLKAENKTLKEENEDLLENIENLENKNKDLESHCEKLMQINVHKRNIETWSTKLKEKLELLTKNTNLNVEKLNIEETLNRIKNKTGRINPVTKEEFALEEEQSIRSAWEEVQGLTIQIDKHLDDNKLRIIEK